MSQAKDEMGNSMKGGVWVPNAGLSALAHHLQTVCVCVCMHVHAHVLACTLVRVCITETYFYLT